MKPSKPCAFDRKPMMGLPPVPWKQEKRLKTAINGSNATLLRPNSEFVRGKRNASLSDSDLDKMSLKQVEAQMDKIMIGPYRLSYIREYTGWLDDLNLTDQQLQQVYMCVYAIVYV
jgi:hypothetical protein